MRPKSFKFITTKGNGKSGGNTADRGARMGGSIGFWVIGKRSRGGDQFPSKRSGSFNW